MKWEKRSICRWLTVFALVLTISLFPAQKSEAANYSLTPNNTWISQSITTPLGSDLYTFSIPSAGIVTIDYQGWSITDSKFSVMTADQSLEFSNHSLYGSSGTNPKTKSVTLALEPGSYSIKVSAPSSKHMGEYRLRAAFQAAGTNERESNNTFETAIPLGAGSQVTGFISLNDPLDFYSFYVPSTQTVKLTYTSMVTDSVCELWDKNFQSVNRKTIFGASESNPKSHVYEADLAPGTYYVKISAYSEGIKYKEGNDYGRYRLKWETSQKIVNVSSITISGAKSLKKGQTLTLTANVSPSNATNKGVTWRSSNTSVATVSSSGKVTAKGAGTTTITVTAADGSKVSKSCTITVTAPTTTTTTAKKVTSISISGNKKIAVGSKLQLKATVSPSNAKNKKVSWTSSNKKVATVNSSGKVTAKKPGKAVITAKAKDGSGKKKSVTVIVVPKKMSAPTVTSPAKKKISVTLKKQSNVSGYQVQYAKNNKFKSAKTYNAGKNTKKVTISKLTRKKTYYVRTRSYIKIGSKKYYGAWSKVRTIKVK